MPRGLGAEPFCVYDLQGEPWQWSDWDGWMAYMSAANDNPFNCEDDMEFDSFTAYPEYWRRKAIKKIALYVGVFFLSGLATAAVLS